MINLNITAQNMYLDILCARNYRSQEPAYKYAKWYHLFWLLIPIVGIFIFIDAVKNSYWNN